MGRDLNGKELGKGIMQLPNGKYTARFYNKFGIRKSIYDWNLTELKRRYNTAVYDDQNTENLIDENITLNEWYRIWLEVHKYKVICPNTRRHYDYVYNDFIRPALGKKKLTQITQLDVKVLLRELDVAGYGFSTKDRCRIMLLDMFNKALLDNYVKRNPVKGIKIVRDENISPRVLTREEQTEFFEASKGTFYDNLFVVAINTGLRQGELCALTWEDIDFDNHSITVNKTLVYQKLDGDERKTYHVGPPKTKASNRVVPMCKECEIALKKQYLQRNNIWARDGSTIHINPDCGDLVFVTRLGAPINDQNICDNINRILDSINEMKDPLEQIQHFSSHCFRHTFATRCFEANVAMKSVQEMLGHASIKMTMDLYTHLLPDKKEEEMRKFEALQDEVMSMGDQNAERSYEKAKAKERTVVDFDAIMKKA